MNALKDGYLHTHTHTHTLTYHNKANHYNNGGASQVALVVKNLPANAGDARDVGLIINPWW